MSNHGGLFQIVSNIYINVKCFACRRSMLPAQSIWIAGIFLKKSRTIKMRNPITKLVFCNPNVLGKTYSRNVPIYDILQSPIKTDCFFFYSRSLSTSSFYDVFKNTLKEVLKNRSRETFMQEFQIVNASVNPNENKLECASTRQQVFSSAY